MGDGMLKLSKKVDYGLIAIGHIAYREADRVVTARHIAGEYNIPQELLAKILQRLAKKGLITSQNGPKGGYVLARDPHEITVGDVIKAIEGPIDLVDCSVGDDCPQMDKCTVRTPIRGIQRSITQMFDNLHLDEFVRMS